MPQKNNKRRGKPTHHVLTNQALQLVVVRSKCSNLRVKTLRPPLLIWEHMLMKKLRKSRSPSTNISRDSSSTRHSIYSPAKSVRPRCSCLHRLNTHGACAKREASVFRNSREEQTPKERKRNSLLTRQRTRQVTQALALNPFHLQEPLLHPLQPFELTALRLQILFLGLQRGPKHRELLFCSLGPLLSNLLAA